MGLRRFRSRCQWYLNSIGYEGQKSQCFDGRCWTVAFALHQQFKWDFIANAPHEGITIPMVEIKAWFDAHLTDDLKSMYGLIEDEGD